jgi:hypothetical protein
MRRQCPAANNAKTNPTKPKSENPCISQGADSVATDHLRARPRLDLQWFTAA